MRTNFWILIAIVGFVFASCGSDDEDINVPIITATDQIQLADDNLIGIGSPIITSDRVYISLMSMENPFDITSTIVALDHSKNIIWEKSYSREIADCMIMRPDGNIIIGTKEVSCIDTDGNIAWDYTIPNNRRNEEKPAAGADNTTYIPVKGAMNLTTFVFENASLIALDANGAQLWETVFPSSESNGVDADALVALAPVVISGVAYVPVEYGDEKTRFFAVSNGVATEYAAVEGHIFGDCAIDANNRFVCVTSDIDHTFNKLNLVSIDGTVEAIADLSDFTTSQIVIDASNNIYFGKEDDHFVSYSESGTLNWQSEESFFSRCSFIITDNSKLYHFQQNVTEIDMTSGAMTTISGTYDILGGDLAICPNGQLVYAGGLGIIRFVDCDATTMQNGAVWGQVGGNAMHNSLK